MMSGPHVPLPQRLSCYKLRVPQLAVNWLMIANSAAAMVAW